MIASLSDLLSPFLPGSASTTAAGITVWAFVIGLVVWFTQMFFKAFEDHIKTGMKWLFGTWARGAFVAGWIGFIAVAAISKSVVMFAAALVVAPLLALSRYYRRLALWIVAMISVIAMAGSFGIDQYRKNKNRQAVRVYFVLAFENESRPVYDQDVEKIWVDCKQRLQNEVFHDVSWVQINPKSEEYKVNRWDLGHPERILAQDSPDVLLRTWIKVLEVDPKTVRVVLELTKLVPPNSLVPLEIGRARQTLYTRLDDRQFMSLAVAAWLWRWVENNHWDRVRPSDSPKVNKRILDLYASFLERNSPQSPIISKIQAALTSPTDAVVRDLLNEYPKPDNTNAAALEEEKSNQIASRISPGS